MPHGAIAIVYHDEIHLLGSAYAEGQRKHWKLVNNNWEVVEETMPFSVSTHICPYSFVINDKIHLLSKQGSNGQYYNAFSLYKWDSGIWSKACDLPIQTVYREGLYCSVIDNELHMLYFHNNELFYYKWDGESWTELAYVPFTANEAVPALYKGEVHIFTEMQTTTSATATPIAHNKMTTVYKEA